MMVGKREAFVLTDEAIASQLVMCSVMCSSLKVTWPQPWPPNNRKSVAAFHSLYLGRYPLTF
jgi:hypothetical protein